MIGNPRPVCFSTLCAKVKAWLRFVYVCLPLCLPACLPACLSVFLSVYLSVYLVSSLVSLSQNKTKQNTPRCFTFSLYNQSSTLTLPPPTRVSSVVHSVHPPLRVRAQSMGGNPHDLRPRLLCGGHSDEPLRAAACTAGGHGPSRRSRYASSRR